MPGGVTVRFELAVRTQLLNRIGLPKRSALDADTIAPVVSRLRAQTAVALDHCKNKGSLRDPAAARCGLPKESGIWSEALGRAGMSALPRPIILFSRSLLTVWSYIVLT